MHIRALAAATVLLAGACSGGSDQAATTVTTTALVPTPVRITVTPEAPWSAGTPTTSVATSAPAATATTQQAPATSAVRPNTRPNTRPTSRAAPLAPAPRSTRRVTTSKPTTAARSGTVGGVLVPNFRGASLTAAFARLADLGVSRTRRSPHDVSGKGRTVLQPNNWQVCSQRPAPGTRASAETVYEFGVVKFGERCP